MILEWIEETHPDPPLWPADPDRRGQARAWARYIDDALLDQLLPRPAQAGLRPRRRTIPEDIVERLHARVPRQWPRIEAALAEHRRAVADGRGFTYADLTGLPLAVRLPEWAPQLAPGPAGATRSPAAWLEALRERPSAAAIDAAGEQLRLEALNPPPGRADPLQRRSDRLDPVVAHRRLDLARTSSTTATRA